MDLQQYITMVPPQVFGILGGLAIGTTIDILKYKEKIKDKHAYSIKLGIGSTALASDFLYQNYGRCVMTGIIFQDLGHMLIKEKDKIFNIFNRNNSYQIEDSIDIDPEEEYEKYRI